MIYQRMKQGVFLARPNRFIAHVVLDGQTVVCHVKNTGRCRELLVEGAKVYLQEAENPNRKTKYDLIAVEKVTPNGVLLVNIDAQAPNQVFAEWAQGGNFVAGLTLLRPETTWGQSRFDFYWEAGERKGFVEVKGVTLENDGHAQFPDAPTQRGVKQVEELLTCRGAGYEAAICFVVQMEGMTDFSPNWATHPAFGEALQRAQQGGVEILVKGCRVGKDSLTLAEDISLVI